jgi:hypothetical protein
MQITSIIFHAPYFGEEEEASAAFCFPKRGKIASLTFQTQRDIFLG